VLRQGQGEDRRRATRPALRDPHEARISPWNLKYVRFFAAAWPDRRLMQHLAAQMPFGDDVRDASAEQRLEERDLFGPNDVAHIYTRAPVPADGALHARSQVRAARSDGFRHRPLVMRHARLAKSPSERFETEAAVGWRAYVRAMMLPYRNKDAAERFAARRRCEDEAPRLHDRVPGLTSLLLDVEELTPIGGTKHIRRVLIDRAPALFLVPCGDPRCADGGHDLTATILPALQARKASFRGADPCSGSVWPGGDCGRILHFEGRAEYRFAAVAGSEAGAVAG
jgi:hypothetical protein